jgi:hypothetical protein
MKHTKVKRSNLRNETWTARPGISQWAKWIEWNTVETVDDGASVFDDRRIASVPSYELKPDDLREFEIIAGIAWQLNGRIKEILERHLARKAKRKVPR